MKYPMTMSTDFDLRAREVLRPGASHAVVFRRPTLKGGRDMNSHKNFLICGDNLTALYDLKKGNQNASIVSIIRDLVEKDRQEWAREKKGKRG